MTFDELEFYIINKMRMSHVYQPVMLKTLIASGCEASVSDIAQALLAYDQSQIEYYSLRTKKMVGKVLTTNGVVEPLKHGNSITGYRLSLDSASEQQRAQLTALCEEKIAAFIDQRGVSIWEHRGAGREAISGSIRYEVLKRAKFRCELCGAHETQIALHIDHIIPKAKGGSDDISNFQALCLTCNTNKRDRDDTDFRGILESYEDRDSSCIFCMSDVSAYGTDLRFS